MDVDARRRAQPGERDRLIGRPQAGVRRDHQRHAESRRVGELASEVQAGHERHHFAQGRAAPGAQSPCEVEVGAGREEQLRALAAAVGGGEEEDSAFGHR